MTSENDEKSTTWWGLITVLAIVGVIVILGLIEAGVYISFHKWEHRGLLGDMFGVGNAVFSALAFAGVIIAILMQKKELELQRKELKLTRDEVTGQRDQLQSQAETLKKQTLGNTFFELLRFHQEIFQALWSSVGEGRVAISNMARAFRDEYSQSEQMESEGERIRAVYNKFHQTYQSHVGHYFRNLYQILRFIKDSQAGEKDKKLYGRLVRAQLSSNELFLLFYNCLSEVGIEKFKPLVEEFAMLKHIPRESLILLEHMELYNQRAFGEAEQN